MTDADIIATICRGTTYATSKAKPVLLARSRTHALVRHPGAHGSSRILGGSWTPAWLTLYSIAELKRANNWIPGKDIPNDRRLTAARVAELAAAYKLQVVRRSLT